MKQYIYTIQIIYKLNQWNDCLTFILRVKSYKLKPVAPSHLCQISRLHSCLQYCIMHIATFCTLAYCNVLQHFILQTLQKPGGPALMWCASFIHIDEGSLISYSRGCRTYYWRCRTFMHSIAVLLSQNHCSASDCTSKTIISQYYLLCFLFVF